MGRGVRHVSSASKAPLRVAECAADASLLFEAVLVYVQAGFLTFSILLSSVVRCRLTVVEAERCR